MAVFLTERNLSSSSYFVVTTGFRLGVCLSDSSLLEVDRRKFNGSDWGAIQPSSRILQSFQAMVRTIKLSLGTQPATLRYHSI